MQRAAAVLAACGGLIGVLAAGERVRGLLASSAWLTLGTLAVCLPVGTLAAVVVEKTCAPGRKWLRRALVGLLLVPLCVQAAAWQTALGLGGWLASEGQMPWLSGWRGAVWVHGLAGVPWVAVIVGAALRTVDRHLEEAALQDSSPGTVVRRISLRAAMPAVAAAALWVASICATEISVTDFFQVRTFAEEVYTQASLGALDGAGQGDLPAGTGWLSGGDLFSGALVQCLLCAAAVLAVAGWLEPIASADPGNPWRWDSPRARWGAALVALVIGGVVVAAPAASLFAKAGVKVEKTGDGFTRIWSAAEAARLVAESPYEHRRELGWSVTIGAAAATLVTALAVVLAWAARTRRIPSVSPALLAALLLAVPPPIVGVWVIHLLNQPEGSPLAWLTWCYDHTVLAPVLVQSARVLPVALVVVWLQLRSVSADVVASATADGAGWWSVLLRIALPMRARGVCAVWLLSLVLATGEVAGTLLVAPPGVTTLAVRVFSLLHYGAEDRVAALCLAIALAAAIGAGASAVLLRRGREGGQGLMTKHE